MAARAEPLRVGGEIRPVRRSAPLRADSLAFLALLSGAGIGIRLDLVGEVYVVELLLPMVALFAVMSRGAGKFFHARTLALFLAAGAVTFAGYLISDLVAANDEWQYLRGWGRVILLMIDCIAILLLVGHSPRNLWWFALGLGLGGIGWLMATGVGINTWKIGYGEYTAFLVAVMAGLLPRYLGAAGLLACGIASVLLDYRSLGAACMLSAALSLYAGRRRLTRKLDVRAVASVAALIVLALSIMLALLSGTQDSFEDRRQMSNGGRYIGVVVALRAIAESPVLGYGSWAAEGRFAQMLRLEAARLERELGKPVEVGRSLLPHSQLLQAWVEGGVLGAAFFLVYGAMLIWALYWFVLVRPGDWLTGIAIFALMYGLWNYMASPFLGFTRIYIAMAVGVIGVARWESTRVGHPLRTRAWRESDASSAIPTASIPASPRSGTLAGASGVKPAKEASQSAE